MPHVWHSLIGYADGWLAAGWELAPRLPSWICFAWQCDECVYKRVLVAAGCRVLISLHGRDGCSARVSLFVHFDPDVGTYGLGSFGFTAKRRRRKQSWKRGGWRCDMSPTGNRNLGCIDAAINDYCGRTEACESQVGLIRAVLSDMCHEHGHTQLYYYYY